MRLYTPRQRIHKQYGRGIGDLLVDAVTSDAFKGGLKTLSSLGLEGLKSGLRTGKDLAIQHLGTIGKDLGKAALDTGKAFLQEQTADVVSKAISGLDKKIGVENTTKLLNLTKAGLDANKGKMDPRVVEQIDKQLNAISRTPVSQNKGKDLITSLRNATDNQGVILPNVDEIIKLPEVALNLPEEVFNTPTPTTASLSNLLAGSGSKRLKMTKDIKRVKKGKGLFLPGTSSGSGLTLPGRGMSGGGIAYI